MTCVGKSRGEEICFDLKFRKRDKFEQKYISVSRVVVIVFVCNSETMNNMNTYTL